VYETRYGLVLSDFEIDAGEYGAKKFDRVLLDFPACPESSTAAKICEAEGLDWGDAGFLLTWSVG
jgi:hypothetical protein